MSATGRELILYATPAGPLAAAVDRYYETVDAALTSTTAQTYPPHCTLTGFFRRDDDGARSAVEEIGRALTDAGPVPDGAVEVVSLTATDEWVGLELRSPWLRRLTDRIVAAHQTEPGEEALRVKDRLHLSLAYGIDDLGPHADLAAATVDPASPVSWEVALWERRGDGSWLRHDPDRDRPAATR
jgi:ubiquitin-associated SH3 domain-containing protein